MWHGVIAGGKRRIEEQLRKKAGKKEFGLGVKLCPNQTIYSKMLLLFNCDLEA